MVRDRIANPLFTGSNPVDASSFHSDYKELQSIVYNQW